MRSNELTFDAVSATPIPDHPFHPPSLHLMSGAAHRARMQRECIMLETQPPPGINAWRINDQLNHWNAQIRGPADSPYAGGIFKVELRVSDRYPFEPPRVSFLTPIYHPNIDSAGIICLDTLNMPPKGSWSPGSNLCTTLASVEQLMAYPNPNDGLVAEVTKHFNDDRSSFNLKAMAMTRQFAMAGNSAAAVLATGAASTAAAAASHAAAASSSAAAAAAAAPASAAAPAPAASSSAVSAPTASAASSTPAVVPVAVAAAPVSGSKRSAEDAAAVSSGSDSAATATTQSAATAPGTASEPVSEPNAKKARVEAPINTENDPPQSSSA